MSQLISAPSGGGTNLNVATLRRSNYNPLTETDHGLCSRIPAFVIRIFTIPSAEIEGRVNFTTET